jgi:hypothetical protein
MTSTRLLAGLLTLLLIGACALQSHAEDTSRAKEGPGAGATTAAAVSDVFYVPGKAIVCGARAALSGSRRWPSRSALSIRKRPTS